MKKILGVSIAAMLAVTPMIASATGSAPTAATTSDEPFVGVTLDTDANIATTSYVQGAYNAAIGAVNKRLVNDKASPATINQTVKTTLETTVNSASDTHLVTEKAIATALQAVSQGAAITGGAGVNVAGGNVISVDLTQSGTGNDAYNASGLVMTGEGNAATLGINKGNGLEVISTSGADQGKLAVKGGDGIAVDSNGVAVDLVTTNPTLQITSNKLEAKVGDGLQKGSSGIEVKLTSNKGLQLDSSAKSLEVLPGDGIAVGSGGVAVDLTDNTGLIINSTTKKLEIKNGDGIKAGANGIEVDLKSGGGLSIDNGQIKLTNDVTNATNTTAYSGTGLATTGYVAEAIAGGISGKATEAGVTATISQSTVPVYTTWNNTNTANVNIQSSYYRTDERTGGVNAAPQI